MATWRLSVSLSLLFSLQPAILAAVSSEGKTVLKTEETNRWADEAFNLMGGKVPGRIWYDKVKALPWGKRHTAYNMLAANPGLADADFDAAFKAKSAGQKKLDRALKSADQRMNDDAFSEILGLINEDKKAVPKKVDKSVPKKVDKSVPKEVGKSVPKKVEMPLKKTSKSHHLKKPKVKLFLKPKFMLFSPRRPCHSISLSALSARLSAEVRKCSKPPKKASQFYLLPNETTVFLAGISPSSVGAHLMGRYTLSGGEWNGTVWDLDNEFYAHGDDATSAMWYQEDDRLWCAGHLEHIGQSNCLFYAPTPPPVSDVLGVRITPPFGATRWKANISNLFSIRFKRGTTEPGKQHAREDTMKVQCLDVKQGSYQASEDRIDLLNRLALSSGELFTLSLLTHFFSFTTLNVNLYLPTTYLVTFHLKLPSQPHSNAPTYSVATRLIASTFDDITFDPRSSRAFYSFLPSSFTSSFL